MVKQAVNTDQDLINLTEISQSLSMLGKFISGIIQEVNSPVQYIQDNLKFLQEAFLDYQDLLSAHQKLVDALSVGKVTQQHLDKVTEIAARADIEYLEDEAPKAIDQALDGIKRVGTLVQSMTDFMQSGTEEISTIDFNKAIASTLTFAESEWKYGSNLEIDFDPALDRVPCFSGELNVAVLNLVVHASKANIEALDPTKGEKGIIRVSTRWNKENQQIEIRIADTGKGIPDEDKDDIFTPKFSGNEDQNTLGQGLAIAQALLRGHLGGSLGVESEAGKGSTFIVRLPFNGEVE